MRVVQGDEGFEEAFSALYRRARTVAYRIVGTMTEAEDAAAEAMARALVAWRRVGPLSYREAWVAKVAANVAVDTVRKRGRRAFATTGALDEEDGVVLRIAISAALARLPRRQREVIALRYLTGMTEAEVAACLGLSANSVKTHAARGMASLRGRLGPDWKESELANR